ncbi:hypothetical protein T484DRAFT_1874665, partial [Baffinella frigidus]
MPKKKTPKGAAEGHVTGGRGQRQLFVKAKKGNPLPAKKGASPDALINMGITKKKKKVQPSKPPKEAKDSIGFCMKKDKISADLPFVGSMEGTRCGVIVDVTNVAARGFGFVKPDDGSDNVYFHLSGKGNLNASSLPKGTKVTYTLGVGKTGIQ